jgi:hypothetical protein
MMWIGMENVLTGYHFHSLSYKVILDDTGTSEMKCLMGRT